MSTTQVFHVVGNLFTVPKEILVINGQTYSPTADCSTRGGRVRSVYKSNSLMFSTQTDEVESNLKYMMDGEDVVVVYHGLALQPQLVGRSNGIENLILTLKVGTSTIQACSLADAFTDAHPKGKVYATIHQDPLCVNYAKHDAGQVEIEKVQHRSKLKAFKEALSENIRVVEHPEDVIVGALLGGMSIQDQLKRMGASEAEVGFVNGVLDYLPKGYDWVYARTSAWDGRVGPESGVMLIIPLGEDKQVRIYNQEDSDLLVVLMLDGEYVRTTNDVKVEGLVNLRVWIRMVEQEKVSSKAPHEDRNAWFLARKAALQD